MAWGGPGAATRMHFEDRERVHTDVRVNVRSRPHERPYGCPCERACGRVVCIPFACGRAHVHPHAPPYMVGRPSARIDVRTETDDRPDVHAAVRPDVRIHCHPYGCPRGKFEETRGKTQSDPVSRGYLKKHVATVLVKNWLQDVSFGTIPADFPDGWWTKQMDTRACAFQPPYRSLTDWQIALHGGSRPCRPQNQC